MKKTTSEMVEHLSIGVIYRLLLLKRYLRAIQILTHKILRHLTESEVSADALRIM